MRTLWPFSRRATAKRSSLGPTTGKSSRATWSERRSSRQSHSMRKGRACASRTSTAAPSSTPRCTLSPSRAPLTRRATPMETRSWPSAGSWFSRRILSRSSLWLSSPLWASSRRRTNPPCAIAECAAVELPTRRSSRWSSPYGQDCGRLARSRAPSRSIETAPFSSPAATRVWFKCGPSAAQGPKACGAR